MTTIDRITQSIEVGNFDRIMLQAINVENEIVIRQGERESLSVTASQEGLAKIKAEVCNGRLTIQYGGNLLDKLSAALATSLTRQHINYFVTVKRLSDLEVAGTTHVDIGALETDQLALRLAGMDDVYIHDLTAKLFEIAILMPSVCYIEVSGRVIEQKILMSGLSTYNARRLVSQRASVTLRNPGGKAIVKVDDDLAVNISGPGLVEYYGQPHLTKNISPLSVVTHLIDLEEVAA